MTARDAAGKFAVVRPLPSPKWTEPGTTDLTPDQRIWVKSAIDHIVAGLEPLPELEPTTGLCEKPIAVPFEGTTLDYICTRPTKHRGKCAPLDTQGRDVLEALAAGEPTVSKHGGA